jgi:uncharacterized protein (TIGR03437 family)
VRADGSQSWEPVFQYNATTGRYVPLPIDLGPATDRVLFAGFGTGFRSVTASSTVTAAIGGTSAGVTHAGPQGEYEGLDQVNVEIPRSLAGRGEVNVVFRVNGLTANAVSISVLWTPAAHSRRAAGFSG